MRKVFIESNDKQEFLLCFYDQYRKFVYKQVWEFCYSKQDIDDIVQNVWEKLIAKEELLRTLAHSQRLTYISKTAENTIKELARKQRLSVCSLDQIQEPIYDGTRFLEQLQDKRMRHECFQTAWTLVDADTRELLERKYLLNETDEEIARVLNISKDSVRMYLSRARRQALAVLSQFREKIL